MILWARFQQTERGMILWARFQQTERAAENRRCYVLTDLSKRPFFKGRATVDNSVDEIKRPRSGKSG
jgi:hypothetical protein